MRDTNTAVRLRDLGILHCDAMARVSALEVKLNRLFAREGNSATYLAGKAEWQAARDERDAIGRQRDWLAG